MTLGLRDIQQARRRIAGGVLCSPCPESVALSELTGMRIFCKLDNLQRTGSFKERGARNALLQLSPAQKRRGVIAASAGNHALGLAYHGSLLRIPVTVVMPRFAPLVKSTTCRRLGAHVVLFGNSFADARGRAEEICREGNLSYIHGYDAPAVIAGQGTLGLEILDQVRGVDAVVVPVGGGGLLAGMAVALKARNPRVRIIAAEAKAAPGLTSSLRAGRPAPTRIKPTLADGLAVPQLGGNAFALLQGRVDEIIQVTEDEIALSILRIVEREHIVVEGASAVPLAACLSGRLAHLRGRTVVLPFCGGNIDPGILSRVIEKGLVADGRLARFLVTISDRPGGLAGLATLLAEEGASIKDVAHERAFAGADVSAVNVVCTVETRDRAHIRSIQRALRRHGFGFFHHGARGGRD